MALKPNFHRKRNKGKHMGKKLIGLSTVLLLSSCSEQFVASKQVHSHVNELLSQSDIDVSSVLFSVQHDEATLNIEEYTGVELTKHFIFPRPNTYQGSYEIEYACKNKKCSLLYNESAAESLNDEMIISLFDEYAQKGVNALEQKVKMTKD